MGSQDLSTGQDGLSIVLDILTAHKHPAYNGNSSYYDVAVLTVKPVVLSEVTLRVSRILAVIEKINRGI